MLEPELARLEEALAVEGDTAQDPLETLGPSRHRRDVGAFIERIVTAVAGAGLMTCGAVETAGGRGPPGELPSSTSQRRPRASSTTGCVSSSSHESDGSPPLSAGSAQPPSASPPSLPASPPPSHPHLFVFKCFRYFKIIQLF